jgi:hypothetical protein
MHWEYLTALSKALSCGPEAFLGSLSPFEPQAPRASEPAARTARRSGDLVMAVMRPDQDERLLRAD